MTSNSPIPKSFAMRDAVLSAVYEAMGADANIFFVTADFGSPVLDKIRSDRGGRYVNVGIAEQNLINVSAGLALEGFKVFAYAIAPFITMRCFEQIRINLALLSQTRPLNVNLVGVGAGYSYVVSGPTHQCYEDITLMRSLPSMQVLSPADQYAASALVGNCLHGEGPKYLRLDAQPTPLLYANQAPDLPAGFTVQRKGDNVCIIATGYMVHTALRATAKLAVCGMEVGVIDLFNLTGFDAGKLSTVLSNYRGVVTLEEGFSGRGGLDAMIFDYLARSGLRHPMLNIGVEGGYRFEVGDRECLHELVGIGERAVIEKVGTFVQRLFA